MEQHVQSAEFNTAAKVHDVAIPGYDLYANLVILISSALIVVAVTIFLAILDVCIFLCLLLLLLFILVIRVQIVQLVMDRLGDSIVPFDEL